MADWPALDVRPSAGAPEPVHTDFVIAAVDAFAPTAVEEHGDRVRIFFATTAGRDAAAADLASGPMAGALVIEPLDVADEDWARRSQASLQAVTVGRITVRPAAGADDARESAADGIVITIPPSMGFGTGHHATTQLCLEALQSVDLRDRSVLDVGTGSGILAIAASRLGAGPVAALDHDEHALASAAESLALNRDAHVALRTADLVDGTLPTADVVVANLTGALLVRAAATLSAAVKPGGLLIVSGLLVTERADVSAAFRPWPCTASAERGEWAALVLERPIHSAV